MRFGEYEVLGLLGQGGMSEVYQVEHTRLGSHHALKLFTYDRPDPEVRQRFEAEGRILARLHHPRIMHVTDWGVDAASGRPYFVMDLIVDADGHHRSLADLEPGSADEEAIGRWYDDLVLGLNYIHAHGIVHRDLKLQNVLLGPDGHAVLTDFGISKVLGNPGDASLAANAVRTVVRQREGRSLLMGSLGYLAPELELGVAASPQSDYYALGVIVYKLLTDSWCDARTDVARALETYDPVWQQIVPALLHTHPDERRLLAYAELKIRERLHSEREAEDRLEDAQLRNARLRRQLKAALLGTATLAALGAAAFITRPPRHDSEEIVKLQSRLLNLEWQLNFNEKTEFYRLFEIPANLPDERQQEYYNTRTDALVIAQPVLAKLVHGSATSDEAADELEAMAFDISLGESPFDKTNYRPIGTNDILAVMLYDAANKIRKADK